MQRMVFWLEGFKDLFNNYKNIAKHSWSNRQANDLRGYTHEEAEFLPTLLAFQEKPVSSASRIFLWSFISLVIIAIVGSIIAKIDIVASAPGKITTDSGNKLIQPLEPARINNILVKEGQRVKAGQTLIEIDSTDAKANAVSAYQKYISTKLIIGRSQALLQAFSGQAAPKPIHVEGINEDLLKQENQLTQTIYKEYGIEQKRLSAEQNRRQAEKNTLLAQAKKTHDSLQFTEARTSDYKRLVDKDYISRHEFLKYEQNRVEQKGDLSIQYQRTKELNAAINETAEQKAAFEVQTLKKYNEILADAQLQLPSLAADYEKHKQRLKNLSLTSPVNGIVQQVNVHTKGGIASPAEPLMIIVPEGEPIEIEAMVDNKDIGFIRLNQEAEVKVDAFAYTKYGTLKGKVVNISPDAKNNGNNQLAYMVTIQLDKHTMNVNGQDFTLTPGMTVNVEIKTGQRRLIEYFLTPFAEYKTSSLKER